MLLKRSILLLGMIVFATGIFAQTLADAGEKYNAGNEQYKAKAYGNAVKLYEEALSMCKNLGGSAADLQANVEKQLLNAYFKNGLYNYKKKKFDAAIDQLTKTRNLAKELNDSKMEKKAVLYIARVYSTRGNILVKKADYKGAFEQYNKALEIRPNCINSYLGMANAYKKQGDMNNMMKSVDKVVELGKSNSSAAKKVAKAKKLAFLALKANGAEELQKEHAAKALEYLTAAPKYGKADADIYYYTAMAQMKQKKWDDAIANAKKAIELNPENKADIYFTLGQAYQGKGDNANACASFKKVTSGPNVAAAKYQMEQVLKCK